MTAVRHETDLLNLQHHWTIADYHRMIEAGILTERDKVELLDGKIIKMSPKGRLHSACISRLNKFCIKQLSDHYECRPEQPINFLDISEPEPDYVIARLDMNSYVDGHPGAEDIHLIIEVADSSLAIDRGSKLKNYAAANILEYWIINLVDAQIEVYTEPNAKKMTYDEVVIFKEGSSFEHELLGKVVVGDLVF
ncbi:MAG: Uma2 family endonuclease [Bacteroidota bacterium]